MRRSLPSFLGLHFLNFSEKIAIARALLAIRREHSTRSDLDSITMLQWLEEKRQPARAIDRFWRQVLVSAINEELDRMAAIHGFQVFLLGFLSNPQFYQMGIPAVPLAQLYSADGWKKLGNVQILPRTPVQQVVVENGVVRALATSGGELQADFYVSAVPFDRIAALVPELAPDLAADLSHFEHSPITGIHLWFDRPITDLPHATLLDRTIQWMFNKGQGRYIELVISASRILVETKREDVIALAVRELAEFFPAVHEAKLEKSHVVKEIRATFSAKPGLEAHRPLNRTSIRNLFLAGDWTRSGWPATMEGAVRSGYLAAEAVTQAAGSPRRFLLP
jgi:zeta-carotene desaturase